MKKICPTCRHTISNIEESPRCPRCNTILKKLPSCEDCTKCSLFHKKDGCAIKK